MYGPGSSTNLWGSQNDAQNLRLKQIDSLRQLFPTVREMQRDLVYEIAFTITPARRQMNLRISLPKEFPQQLPTLQLLPANCSHRLLDRQGYVLSQAHENLMRWTVHASLGKTVYEIVQKFMQEPPQLMESLPPQQQQQSPVSYPYPQSASQPPTYPPQNNSPYPPTRQPSIPEQITHTPLPEVPSLFPELEGKTPTELSQLLNDENEFKKFFDNLGAVTTLRKVRDDLKNNTEELAKKNFAKEVEIEQLRKENAARMKIVEEKREAFQQKAQQQTEVMKRFSTPALIEQLSDAATIAEKASDVVAEKFLSGGMDYKEFIKEFIEKRKIFHLRAVKKESLMMTTR